MPRPPFFACLSLIVLGLFPETARADDGVDHAFQLRRPSSGMTWGSASDGLTMSEFDPGVPRVGLALIAAYGPTPLLLFEGLAENELNNRPFTIVELITAGIGSVVSVWAFAEALGREDGSNIAIGSLAAGHALSWNLELLSDALSRLLLGDVAPAVEVPSFLVFPVNGGAGVTVRWEE